MSDNIFVKHEAVAGSAQEIRDLADTMDQALQEATKNMRSITGEYTKGQYSNALEESYGEFSQEFPKYLEAVRNFADMYEKSNATLQEHEIEEARRAQQL